jgi:hypothetical protein
VQVFEGGILPLFGSSDQLLVYDDGVTVAVKRFARSFACIFSGSRRPSPSPCPCPSDDPTSSTIFSRLHSTQLNRQVTVPVPVAPQSLIYPTLPYPTSIQLNTGEEYHTSHFTLHTSHLLRTKLIHIHYILSRLQSIVLRPCPNNAPSRSSSGCFESQGTAHPTLLSTGTRALTLLRSTSSVQDWEPHPSAESRSISS